MSLVGKSLASKWQYLVAQESVHRAPVLTMSRLLSWRARCYLRRPGTTRLKRWNLEMYLPPNWRGVEKLIFAFRELYEPELGYLDKLLSPGMLFVDAGACYGIYSLAAAKMIGPSGFVLAFEPASRAFRVLQRNIELNRLTNISAFPLALTEKRGKAWLYHHPNVGCDSLGKDHSFTETGEEIRTESLDGLLQETGIRQVDVIKIDVQGAEELVLQGAESTIRSQHPVIIFEIFPEGPPAIGLSPYGAWDLLDRIGYKFFVIDSSGNLKREIAPPPNRNVVAIYQD